jgi:probable HAF family extracellular repeat protein
MLGSKAYKFAIFAAVCLVGIGVAGSVHARCPAVGYYGCATVWSNGTFINLGAPPGSTFSGAFGINDSGQLVGLSYNGSGPDYATEWSGGSVINLNPPGSTFSGAFGINDAGQVVG